MRPSFLAPFCALLVACQTPDAALDAPVAALDAPAALVDTALVDAPTIDARLLDAHDAPLDASTSITVDASCMDTCAGSPYCGGDALLGCADTNGDGCLERVTLETCPSACWDGRCVACRTSRDCPDVVRSDCEGDACVPSHLWAEVTITLDGVGTFEYGERDFGDVTYSDSTGRTMIRLQQGEGFTVWSLTLGPDAITGPQPLTTISGNAYLSASLTDHAIPMAYRGGYENLGGTLTLTRADVYRGGRFEGTIAAPLRALSGSATGTFVATFYAEIP